MEFNIIRKFWGLFAANKPPKIIGSPQKGEFHAKENQAII